VCRHLGQVGRLPRSRKIANSPLWVDQWEARETVRLKRGQRLAHQVRDVTPLIGTDRFADQLTPIEVLLLADPVEIAQKLWPRVVRTQGPDKGTPSNNLN
jgi:hypothetical protein